MDGCQLNMSISALACAIAKGKSQNELSILSVFFTQLADAIETIATTNSICCDNNENIVN